MTLDKLQRIKVTHETARAIEFCLVAFLNNRNKQFLKCNERKNIVSKNFTGIDLTLEE